MSDMPNRLSLTPTTARQTPKNEFGNVLKDTLARGAQVSGALLGGMPGGGVISAAVSQVTSFATQGSGRSTGSVEMAASAGTVSVGNGVGGTSVAGGGSTLTAQVAGSNSELPGSLTGYIDQMRAEADRSMAMQMQMQQESRDYNTLSNVLKVRHDSAKAAINNVR